MLPKLPYHFVFTVLPQILTTSSCIKILVAVTYRHETAAEIVKTMGYFSAFSAFSFLSEVDLKNF
jgi:hypothetical protein